MAQRRFHYEQAFEHYLRANRVPYVAVDEAKKALLPAEARSTAGDRSGASDATGGSIKSFDFVVYAPQRKRNLLIDVKGRMFGSAASRSSISNRRLESWVTLEDVNGLERWQAIFGEGFEAVFVFAYCLRQQPPDALFEELFTFAGRWYALREVSLARYRASMTDRSRKWGTVHIPKGDFSRISRPFSLRPTAPTKRPGRSCGDAQVVLC